MIFKETGSCRLFGQKLLFPTLEWRVFGWMILVIISPVGAETPANRSLEVNSNSTAAQIQALRDNMVQANAEAERYRRLWQELQLRNEALGVDLLTGDQQRLEDRVVQSIRELYQTEKQRREAVEALNQIVEATQKVLKNATGITPEARAEYEATLRAAKDVLSGKGRAAIPLGADLSNGRIADLNPELNAVILNLGSLRDVKVGMPFRVFRNDRAIGLVRVFQTREQISGALVEAVEKGFELKIGDRVAVAARSK